MKGDTYEGLLEKNAEDTKGGAGQYFTPRPLIKAIVDVMRPSAGRDHLRPGLRHRRLPAGRPRLRRAKHYELDRDQKKHLSDEGAIGHELVDSVARLCVMNLFLHGIGGDDCPIDGGIDSLAQSPASTSTWC